MPSPIPLPSSGSFLGPKISSAIPKITIRCVGWDKPSNINFFSLWPSVSAPPRRGESTTGSTELPLTSPFCAGSFSAAGERNEPAQRIRQHRRVLLEVVGLADVETSGRSGIDIHEWRQRFHRLRDVAPTGSALVAVVVRRIHALRHTRRSGNVLNRSAVCRQD